MNDRRERRGEETLRWKTGINGESQANGRHTENRDKTADREAGGGGKKKETDIIRIPLKRSIDNPTAFIMTAWLMQYRREMK